MRDPSHDAGSPMRIGRAHARETAANGADRLHRWYGGTDAPARADAGHQRRDRPARASRHHGRHPELQERRDDRLRRARGAGRPRPVLPRPPAGPRQLGRRLARRHRPRRRRDRAARLRRADPARPADEQARPGQRSPTPRSTASAARARRCARSSRSRPRSRSRRSSSSTRTCAPSCPSGSSSWPGPILKGGYDYVAPLYARHKYDGTITNTVTYPLTRALYGLRIRQPIGGDFGVSGDLVRHYLDAGRLDARRHQVRHRHLDDDARAHRRLRGLPGAPRREGPRPQGPGRRPRPDVPPGRQHDPAAGRRARRPLAADARAATTSRPTASSGSSTRRRSRSTSCACCPSSTPGR